MLGNRTAFRHHALIRVALLTTLTVVALTSTTSRAEGPTVSAREFTSDFISLVDKQDVYARGPTWRNVKAELMTAASRTGDSETAYAAVAKALKQIGDFHGGLDPTESATKDYQRRYGHLWAIPEARAPRSDFTDRRAPHGDDFPILGGSVRRIVAPGVFQHDDEQGYAQALFDAVASAPARTCGYILDLRGNVGGDMWPMLAGLSPLLADSTPGAFVYKAAPREAYYVCVGHVGSVLPNGGRKEEFALATGESKAVSDAPVAVLLDDGVMSSGEIVAIAFIGRPHTRSFGAQTYGFTTVNRRFSLIDGDHVYLSAGYDVDRRGKAYRAPVKPDVEVDPAENPATKNAPALSAATAWLARQPPCKQGEVLSAVTHKPSGAALRDEHGRGRPLRLLARW